MRLLNVFIGISIFTCCLIIFNNAEKEERNNTLSELKTPQILKLILARLTGKSAKVNLRTTSTPKEIENKVDVNEYFQSPKVKTEVNQTVAKRPSLFVTSKVKEVEKLLRPIRGHDTQNTLEKIATTISSNLHLTSTLSATKESQTRSNNITARAIAAKQQASTRCSTTPGSRMYCSLDISNQGRYLVIPIINDHLIDLRFIFLEYHLIKKNQLCIDDGKAPIIEESDCRKAATSLKGNFQRKETESAYPKGCYSINNGDVYFNIHPTGKRQEDSAPICQSKGMYKLVKGANSLLNKTLDSDKLA